MIACDRGHCETQVSQPYAPGDTVRWTVYTYDEAARSLPGWSNTAGSITIEPLSAPGSPETYFLLVHKSLSPTTEAASQAICRPQDGAHSKRGIGRGGNVHGFRGTSRQADCVEIPAAFERPGRAFNRTEGPRPRRSSTTQGLLND